MILSFVHPLKLLNQTNDAGTLNGVPRGMTADIVNYFKSHGPGDGLDRRHHLHGRLEPGPRAGSHPVRAAGGCARPLSASASRSTTRRTRTPTSPAFSRSSTPIGPSSPTTRAGPTPAARLTIDTAAGDRSLIGINQKATADWLRTDAPVLDYANAMVPARQPSASSAVASLAGAHRRQAPVQPGGRAARAGQVHRLAVRGRGIPGTARVQQLRRLGDQGHRRLRPARPAAHEPQRAHPRACSGSCSGRPSGRRPAA